MSDPDGSLAPVTDIPRHYSAVRKRTALYMSREHRGRVEARPGLVEWYYFAHIGRDAKTAALGLPVSGHLIWPASCSTDR